jgi:hypothetical protein
MVINYKSPENSIVYILNKNSLITINLNLYTLRSFVKEEIIKICSDPNTNYELGVEEKIELDDKNFAFINKKKKIITFSKKNYDTKEIKIQGYITRIEEIDGNFIVYDKTSNSLEIYYLNGKFLDKVSNHKDVDLIFFFTFPKINSVFFCMNNTINKISFNKKLYWYSQYFNTYVKSPSFSSFKLPDLEEHINDLKNKFLNDIFIANDNESKNLMHKMKMNFNDDEEDYIDGFSSSKEKSSFFLKKCEYCEKEIHNSIFRRSSNKFNEEDEEESESHENYDINDNKSIYYKCEDENCSAVYCSEEHRTLDFKTFHFFHCKLKNFFVNYEYSTQINFFNDLIILINDILKYIFTNISDRDDYLFFLPFIKIITFLFKTLNMKYISDIIVEYSQKTRMLKEDLESLVFYQEVVFYYYNLIILSLNFGVRCNLLDFVKKELDFMSIEEEQIFNKNTILTCTIFNKNSTFYLEDIDLTESNYFFVDDDYISKSKYLRQNDILFTHLIHLYANYIHLADKICKDNPLNIVYLNPFVMTLLSQLIVFFEERNKDWPDDVYVHFISLITPYLTLNRKMLLSTNTIKKIVKITDSGGFKDSIFKVVINHNLGLIQYSTGNHLEGIHNIEKSYKLIVDNDYSYLLRIKVIERLALAYLNIGELLKSFILIKEAICLRTNLLNLYESNPNCILSYNSPINKNDYLYQHYLLLSNNISHKQINYNYNNLYNQNQNDSKNNEDYLDSDLAYFENSMQLVHLFSYINYIQDFVEYEYQIKHMKEKGKKNNEMSKREYQIYLINYVLGKEDMITKNKNFSIIDNYSEDYFRAIEFLYSLDKKILDTLDSDNQTKKNLVNKDEFTAGQNNNISHLSHMNIDDNNSKRHGQFDINNNGNNNSNPIKEEQNILDYDNDIEIKEELFEKLSKNEQLTLTSINTKFFNRNILLRDYYGSINLFNINFHPIYTNEFKKIISKSKHQFFVKVLTQASSTELTNYFFPTTNKNLEGLSKYLQQEEIQNMYKVEKTKILALLKNDTDTNKKYGRTSSEIKNMDISDIEKYQKKKELWISNIKKQLLKEENRSLHEIDQALINLYDNLNDEYKEEISKNPELILYYIFTDIGNSNCYTTSFHIRKSAREDEYNNAYNPINKNSTLYYNNIEDNKMGGKFIRKAIREDSKEEINTSFDLIKKKRKANMHQMAGIPEERKLVFSDNSNSSSDDKNNQKNRENQEKNIRFNLFEDKKRRSNKINSMAEVSESAEGD